MTGNHRNAQLYAVGGRCLLALVGLMLALLGSWPLKAKVEAHDVLVWVNERPITAEQLAVVAHRVTKASPDLLDAEQRQLLLDLLVDEELLLQRAETLGIYDADPGIRKALVQAVIDRVVEDFLAHPVDARQLRHFYQRHQAVFEHPMRMAVSALRFQHQRDAELARAALLDSRVFGYRNMMICDGSTVPANTGVNPSLTITAMSELAMSKVPEATDNWWAEDVGALPAP